MKKWSGVLVGILVAVTLVGCSDQESEAPERTSTESQNTMSSAEEAVAISDSEEGPSYSNGVSKGEAVRGCYDETKELGKGYIYVSSTENKTATGWYVFSQVSKGRDPNYTNYISCFAEDNGNGLEFDIYEEME